MLEKLEEALGCLICKELLEIPEQGGCDHTFCALCIRRHLLSDQHCPVCRKEMHAGALRRVRVLETVVEEFVRVKRACAGEEARVDARENARAPPAPRAPPASLAQCPVCSRELPLEEIQGSHIVECLRPKPQYKRRATVNYKMLKDKELKALLVKDGLSTEGARPKLIARHTEWILLWNVNCAKEAPCTPMELRLRLERWESALQHKQEKVEVAGWAAENREMYRELEAAAWDKLGRPGPRKRRLSEIEAVEE